MYANNYTNQRENILESIKTLENELSAINDTKTDYTENEKTDFITEVEIDLDVKRKQLEETENIITRLNNIAEAITNLKNITNNEERNQLLDSISDNNANLPDNLIINDYNNQRQEILESIRTLENELDTVNEQRVLFSDEQYNEIIQQIQNDINAQQERLQKTDNIINSFTNIFNAIETIKNPETTEEERTRLSTIINDSINNLPENTPNEQVKANVVERNNTPVQPEIVEEDLTFNFEEPENIIQPILPEHNNENVKEEQKNSLNESNINSSNNSEVLTWDDDFLKRNTDAYERALRGNSKNNNKKEIVEQTIPEIKEETPIEKGGPIVISEPIVPTVTNKPKPENKPIGPVPIDVPVIKDEPKDKIPEKKEPEQKDKKIKVVAKKAWNWVKKNKKTILIALGLTAVTIGIIVAVTQLLPAITAAMEASQISSIATQMVSNGLQWHTADAATQAALHTANQGLAAQLTTDFGLTNLFTTNTGIWSLGGTELTAFAQTAAANATAALSAVKTAAISTTALSAGGLGLTVAGLINNKSAKYKEYLERINELKKYTKNGGLTLQLGLNQLTNEINNDKELTNLEKQQLITKIDRIRKKSEKTLEKTREEKELNIVDNDLEPEEIEFELIDEKEELLKEINDLEEKAKKIDSSYQVTENFVRTDIENSNLTLSEKKELIAKVDKIADDLRKTLDEIIEPDLYTKYANLIEKANTKTDIDKVINSIVSALDEGKLSKEGAEQLLLLSKYTYENKIINVEEINNNVSRGGR